MEQASLTDTRRPCLRRDLEFAHRQAGGQTEVIVCDPRTGGYFRARKLEAALFALLDGETPLEAITTRITTAFPGLPAAEVPAFVAQLDRLGFLEGSVAAARRPRPPLYSRLLYARVRLANPDRLFAWLLPYVSWLYRPAGWVAAAALVLVAGAVAVVSREELLRQLAAAATPGFWLSLWIGLSLIGTIHEFGHGLTCKFFGGRSTGIGLLWMYGLPCFYCDVSGAWMLPRKSERLWVSAAGLYYQFFAGAVALLLWRVLEPGTVMSSLLLAMAASCGLFSLLNLNPLLKLDGYYLLSDWLEIPNLRQRAFALLGQRLMRFWFGERRAGPEVPARERRICLVYGALSALFLAWLLSRLLWSLGRFFTGRLGGVGALLLSLIAALVFGPPVLQTGAACGKQLARWKEIPAMARRRLVLVGASLAVAPLALTQACGELYLTSPCSLEGAIRGAVRARTEGRVAELTTHEGAHVRRGEVIGHLATFERKQRRVEREAQLRGIRLEIAALADRLPILAAATEKSAAEAATGAQESRTQLAEEREALPGRRAEAQRRAEAARADLEAARSRRAEARAAVAAQDRVATRLRRDLARAARGIGPPAVAEAQELWRQRVVEEELARRDCERIQLLLADGAVPQQQLDTARTHAAAADRLTAQALEGLRAARQSLREQAEDAEAELARRQAALEAARGAVASAQATEDAAWAAARQVAAASSPAHLQTARLRAASGAAALSAARAARRELLARRMEIHERRQEAERLAAEIAILADQLRRSDLIAPCDGVVTTPHVEERVGAYCGEGATVVEVEDPCSLFTRIFVNEKDLADVRVGRPVLLRLAAFPQRLYRGRVSELAPRAVPGGSAVFPTNVVEVHLRVENPTGELRPGLSGWAKIDCGRRPFGAIFLRRVVRYLRTEVWSWF